MSDRIHQKHCRFALGYVCSCVTAPNMTTDVFPVPAQDTQPQAKRCPICLSDSRKEGNLVPCKDAWHTGAKAAPTVEEIANRYSNQYAGVTAPAQLYKLYIAAINEATAALQQQLDAANLLAAGHAARHTEIRLRAETAEAAIEQVRPLLANYANRESWYWTRDGYEWRGGKWDYRRGPWKDAEQALALLPPAPQAVTAKEKPHVP